MSSARSVITTPISRATGSMDSSRPRRVSVRTSAMIALWPRRSPLARRRSASRLRRLRIVAASSAGRCAWRCAMPCTPRRTDTDRSRRARIARSSWPFGSRRCATSSTSRSHWPGLAPSRYGRRSTRTASTSRRRAGSRAPAPRPTACADSAVMRPDARAWSMRGMCRTRRRELARRRAARAGEIRDTIAISCGTVFPWRDAGTPRSASTARRRTSRATTVHSSSAARAERARLISARSWTRSQACTCSARSR